MTDLLRKAVATLSELPPEQQDALAAMVLEEIVDDVIASMKSRRMDVQHVGPD